MDSYAAVLNGLTTIGRAAADMIKKSDRRATMRDWDIIVRSKELRG
jgi:hypothetical protein